jgi:hypothetical protein
MADEVAPKPPTSLALEFADGTYSCRLGLAQIADLETKCNAGIGEIFQRVMVGRAIVGGDENGYNLKTVGIPHQGTFRLSDVRETIRLGLLGGGEGLVDGQDVTVNDLRANQLVERYCYPNRPLMDDWHLAAAILGACIVGYQNADGEGDGDTHKKKRDDSTSQTH